MSSDLHQDRTPQERPAARERELFDAALNLPIEQRSSFLHDACGPDSSLRLRIEALLVAHARSQLIEQCVPEPSAVPLRSPPLAIASQVGDYRVLERIGEGGMGEVYLAERRPPGAGRVALKVVKAGIDSHAVLSRFQAEQGMLALLDHPAIPRVLDTGVTPGGRPFFAMEYVRGTPITQSCDRAALDTKARLRLFLEVCRGVHHAHQKGVLHRDLKPSNILVTSQADGGRAKIIDFGVAKAIRGDLEDRSVYTRLGDVLGTPDYMSPEQAGAAFDVDTRSDVYSLGVVLYELLVGALPLGRRPSEASAAEVLQITREREPLRPSANPSARSAEVARRRGMGVGPLIRSLRGDLDWILLKCLEKDRNRRYDSVAELAADLERYLANEPVLAGPPSWPYRARKLLRKHRLAASMVLLAIVCLCLGTAWALLEKSRAERNADTSRRALGRARFMVDFLSSTLASGSPYVAQGLDTKLMTKIVEQSAERIRRGDLAQDPESELELRLVLAGVYMDLCEPRLAAEMLEPTEQMARLGWGDQGRWLARVYFEQSRELAERDLHSQAIEKLLAAQTLFRSADGDGTPELARVQNGLAYALEAVGRTEEAIDVAVEAAQTWRRLEGDQGRGVARALRVHAKCLRQLQRAEQALVLAQQAHAIAESQLPTAHVDRIRAHNEVGACLIALGRYEEAARVFDATLRQTRQLHHRSHPDLALILEWLAFCHTRTGAGEVGLEFAREALRVQREAFADDHPQVAKALSSVGYHEFTSKRFDEALMRFTEALEMKRRLHAGDHRSVAHELSWVGRCRERMGQLQAAIEAFEAARGMLERMGAHREDLYPKVCFQLGESLEGTRAMLDAAQSYRTAAEAYDALLGVPNPHASECRRRGGACLLAEGRAEEAREVLTQAERDCRADLPVSEPLLLRVLQTLGESSVALSDYPSAMAAFREARERLLTQGPVPEATLRAVQAGIDECLRGLEGKP